MNPRQKLAMEIDGCKTFPIQADDCKTVKEFLFATVARARLEGWYQDHTPEEWVDIYIQMVITGIKATRDAVRARTT